MIEAKATDTLVDRLWAHADQRPDDVFCHLYSDGGVDPLSWSRLRGEASAHARMLGAAGVKPGEVVLLFIPHGPSLFPPYFGAMALGAVPSYMPLPSMKQDPELYWSSHQVLFDRIKPAAVLTTREHLKAMGEVFDLSGPTAFLAIEDADLSDLSAIAPVPTLDDLALLQHSSGTTGLKKGVALSHRAIKTQLDSYSRALALTSADGIASWLPVYHDMGLIACTLLPVYAGLPLVSLDPFHWLAKPGLLLEAAAEHGSTLIWLPNFAFQHLTRVAPPRRLGISDLGFVRAFINCSEVCRAATFDAFQTTYGPIGLRRDQLQICYAAAETVYAISQTSVGEGARVLTVDAEALGDGRVEVLAEGTEAGQCLLSCGRMIDALDVRIVDDEGAARPQGQTGEVTVTGASLFDGYYNLPEITERKLRDGRYFTSDLGFVHEGELYVLGRRDDVIVVNGRNYMAHDLEAVANRVLGLKPGRNVALGVPNERLGSNDICFVAELDPEADEAAREAAGGALREALLNHADAPAADIQVVEPGWLVKTTSGKISREKNLQKYLEVFGI